MVAVKHHKITTRQHHHILNLYRPSLIESTSQTSGLPIELGVQLFKRNVTEMELTDKGWLAYRMFKDKFQDLTNHLDEYNAASGKITGVVNVILPPVFASKYVNTKIASFIETYPEIQLNISYLVIDEASLNSTSFDLAISRVPISKAAFQQQVIFKTNLILCATPKYLEKHGYPHFEDLHKHNFITFSALENGNKVLAINRHDNSKLTMEIDHYNVIHNSTQASCDIVESGEGLTFLLDYSVEEQLNNGKLIQLFTDYHFGTVKFYLIQSNFESNQKLAAVREFLLECLPHN